MDRNARLVIAGLFAAAITIGTDFVGIGVLLTPIERTFDITVSTSQWVMNAYGLAFAIGVVTGGRLGDMFGRRRVLMVGLGLFGVASSLNAASLDITWLIASRTLQGLGSAMLWPTAIGLMFASAPKGKAGLYIGVMFGLVGLGNVLGPLVAGAVSELAHWGWRLFFVFNLLTSGLAITLLRLGTNEGDEARRTDGRVDYAGIVTLSGSVFALLYALDRATALGWTSAFISVSLAASVVLLIAFFVVEARVRDPLIPPKLWSNRPFVAAVLLNGMQVAPAFIAFIFVPQIGQKVMGVSDFRAALLLLPLMIPFAGLGPLAGRLYDRVGPRPLLLVGYGAVVAGSAWILAVDPRDGFWIWLVPAQTLFGFGIGLTVGPAGTTAVASVDEGDAALASGIAFQWHLVAGVLAIALATFLITSTVSAAIRADTARAGGAGLSRIEARLAQGILTDNPDAVAIKGQLPKAIASDIETQISSAFLSGFQRAFWATGALGIVGLALTRLLPRSRPTPHHRAN